jgi:hypothetical protein
VGDFINVAPGDESPIEKFFVEDKNCCLIINVEPEQKLNRYSADDRRFASRPIAAKPRVVCTLFIFL